MDQATEELAVQRLPVHMPSVGDRGAAVLAIDIEVSLERLPIVLSFYRDLWCPYCNLQQWALQQHVPEITQLGASLAAISLQVARRLAEVASADRTHSDVGRSMSCRNPPSDH
jgi:hypothetical protein